MSIPLLIGGVREEIVCKHPVECVSGDSECIPENACGVDLDLSELRAVGNIEGTDTLRKTDVTLRVFQEIIHRILNLFQRN